MRELRSPPEAAQWLRGRVTGTLHGDSRKVAAGDGFIAWPGAATDGRLHVASALAQGAAACLVEAQGVQAFAFSAPEVASYPQLKAATGPIAASYFEAPSAQLDVLAITGTNGKTSTAWWLAQALSNLRQPGAIPCAMVGTLGIGRPPQVESSGLTTPDPVLLQRQLRRFVDAGVKACAIEASSVGIVERRLDGTRIRVAVFTNFSQDHLDYHGSMEAYWQAKAELFRWPGLRAAVVNLDDEKGLVLARSLEAGGLALWTFSCRQPARLQALDIRDEPAGLAFVVVEGTQRHALRIQRQALRTQLIGRYNVYNLLGVIGAMRALDVPLADAVRACENLLPAPGRMERLGGAGQPLVAVDYAHTPDALEQALQALAPLAVQRGGRLWCVFGCGGDRDAAKRPVMAALAAANAQRVVLTSDNPRSENAQDIIDQMLAGLTAWDAAETAQLQAQTHVQVQIDRALAIAETIAAAAPEDVLLLAGKGHEAWQEIAGVKHPFDDRVHARAALAARGAP